MASSVTIKGKEKAVPHNYVGDADVEERASATSSDSSSESESDSDSDASDHDSDDLESESEDEITEEYMNSLLEKAKEAARANKQSSTRFEEQEVIQLNDEGEST